MPKEIGGLDVKIYATYYTAGKDNAWAKKNHDEVQQIYVMTDFHMEDDSVLRINLMEVLHKGSLKVGDHVDIKRWLEVMYRTLGRLLESEEWHYEDGEAVIKAKKYRRYTVSFPAYIIWELVHMYNAVLLQTR